MSKSVGITDVHTSQAADILEAPVDNSTILKMANAAPSKIEATHAVFKLVETHRNGRVHLPTEDYVVNPGTKEYEKMRLLKGVQSIWEKDQKNLSQHDIKTHAMSLTFEKNILRIPLYEKQTLEFLRTTSMNIGSKTPNKSAKFRFYEYNSEIAAQEALKQDELELEAIIAAKDMPVSKMRKHAAYLNITFADDVTGMPKTDEAVRRDYIRAAKRNPKVFMDTKEDPAVEISFMIKKVISDNKIDLGKQPNSIFWSNGPFICKVTPGQTPVDSLVELALTNSKEGREFKERLQHDAR